MATDLDNTVRRIALVDGAKFEGLPQVIEPGPGFRTTYNGEIKDPLKNHMHYASQTFGELTYRPRPGELGS